MIIWGGDISFGGQVNTGGIYDPVTDSWVPTSTNNAPNAGYKHTAVWTGDRMIVWGGYENTGGVYDPATDSWEPTSTNNAPELDYSYCSAVWTGDRMIVWSANSRFSLGGSYDPASDSWSAISTVNAPVGGGGADYYPRAVWADGEMIVCAAGSDAYNNMGRYDPLTDSWKSFQGYLNDNSTMVWTGTEILVFGGRPDDGSTMWRYIPLQENYYLYLKP